MMSSFKPEPFSFGGSMLFRAVLLTGTGIFFLFVLQLVSCGPSKEEIERRKAEAVNLRYKVGNVVYLKPDSCSALITDTSVEFTNNYDSATVVYVVRDCHGNETTTKDAFIYGLKHR